jgi:hypothetical protein
LTVSTFPARPTALDAVDERGVHVRSMLDTNAGFSLVLTKGHTYRLSVVGGSSSLPVVFPRTAGTLDSTFRISGGGAVVDLGKVRYLASVPAGGITAVGTASAALVSADAGGQSGEVGECVDGTLLGTSTPCVDDDAKMTCDDGEGEETSGTEKADLGEKAGVIEDGKPDGEEADDVVDPNAPLAVPEHNAPADVAGCDVEGEHEDQKDKAD